MKSSNDFNIKNIDTIEDLYKLIVEDIKNRREKLSRIRHIKYQSYNASFYHKFVEKNLSDLFSIEKQDQFSEKDIFNCLSEKIKVIKLENYANFKKM